MSGHGARGAVLRVAIVACAALAAIFAVSCGGGGATDTDSEKAADVEVLDAALARELTAVDAYSRGLPLVSGQMRAVVREFLAQEKEDVDALTKVIRGLGGGTKAEPGKLDFTGIANGAGFLALAYELESAALASYLDAARRLYNPAPRGLAASLAAAHAQHLVVLRQGLGAGLAAAAPEAFDSGGVPPPGDATRGPGPPSGTG